MSACSEAAGADDSAVTGSELNANCTGSYVMLSSASTSAVMGSAGYNGAEARTFLMDADGDGRADIVNVRQWKSQAPLALGGDMIFRIAVHRTDAKAKLSPEESFDVLGHHAEAFFGGDFNGDGRFDLAYLRRGSNELWVIARDSGGGWLPATQVNVPLCGLSALYVRPDSPAVHDVDGDGRADLFMNIRQDDSHEATVLIHGSASGLAKGECVSVTNGYNDSNDEAVQAAGGLALGDFDGDGKLDAFGYDRGEGAHAYSDLLAGPGFQKETFGAPARILPGLGAVGKIDNDGKDDLFVVGDSFYAIYLGRTAPSPGASVLAKAVSSSLPKTSGWERVTPRAGDFNGDGKLDLLQPTYPSATVDQYGHATPTPDNGSYVATTLCSQSNGTPVERSTPLLVTDHRRVETVGAADVNGDGQDDLIVLLSPKIGAKGAREFAVYTLKK